jgi:DNA-binding MarR family transcriptional regulator
MAPFVKPLNQAPAKLFELEQDDALQTFPQEALESRVSDRYGEAGDAGWSPIPDVLLFNQHKLKIQSDDLVVLLNLMAHYYVKDEMPFTRPTTIAKRIGVSQRSVQRSIARLVAQRHILKGKHKTNGHITYDLAPLIRKLQPLGRDRIADRKNRQEQKRSVAQLERASGNIGRI